MRRMSSRPWIVGSRSVISKRTCALGIDRAVSSSLTAAENDSAVDRRSALRDRITRRLRHVPDIGRLRADHPGAHRLARLRLPPAGRVGGVSTSALLRAARDDENVKAVVLRVDSPGGEVFASEQIRREVDALKAALCELEGATAVELFPTGLAALTAPLPEVLLAVRVIVVPW